MTTINLPEGYALTLPNSRANALKAAMAELKLGQLYAYENADGSITRGTWEGYEALNAKFVKEKREKFLAPIVDMRDGSFFTDHLKEAQ